MGDNAEHRGGPPSGSAGDDSRAVNDPLTQADVKAARAELNGPKPE